MNQIDLMDIQENLFQLNKKIDLAIDTFSEKNLTILTNKLKEFRNTNCTKIYSELEDRQKNG